MSTVAKVVVDVPTMQTNQPYDYTIPATMEDAVQPGVRVVVNFGKGKREVMGVVVAANDSQDFDGQLKPILRVLDDHPILNDELLQLSQWLAQDTFAFWITCLQAMLPSALHADTKWLANGAKQVVDRGHVATVDLIVPLKTVNEYDELRGRQRANAKRRITLLAHLAKWTEEDVTPRLHDVVGAQTFDRQTVNVGRDHGWLRIDQKEVYRRPYAHLDAQPRTHALAPSPQQQRALDAIVPAVSEHSSKTFLLEGVTGSGKTEVYLQAIAATLAAGRNALMLIPEIALTPQMVRNVKGRFGTDVAVLHSALSDGERFDEWRRIERGEARVVVGARSAAFAPLTNVGLFIMDEEHETSYKQDDAPRYHARDVLQWRSRYHNAPVVLGSATPSLESRARAAKGVYTHLMMPERANKLPLPPVQIVDMRATQLDAVSGDFSAPLLNALQEQLAHGDQSVLMLNRRGFSSFVMCRECGYVAKCPNCDISLTLHMDSHTLRCHYCGHEEPVPTVCPSCGSRRIRYYGTGTEKVEQTLHQLLPAARVLRMDVDTTRRKGGHAKILRAFGHHEADILLGTQMIAKGLDFPDVTLVGVINADTALGLPDFRASERTFQLLTQVSGRAGRADKPGSVIVQTYNPDHYAIQLAQHHDYERFFATEMNIRHQADYPPYYFTFKLTVSHPEDRQAAKAVYHLADELRQSLSDQAVMLGPTRGAIARLKRRYYYQIVIKYKHEPKLRATLERLLTETQVGSRSGFQVAFDREPLSFV